MTAARLVRLVGGPLDGQEIRTAIGAVQAVVTMADRTQHLYRADEADESGGPPDPSAFVYRGRCRPD